MSAFQIHRDLMSFVILKDGDTVWTGKFNLTPSGFGFMAIDSEDSKYVLASSGILFWRRLILMCNGEEIDQIEAYKSNQTDVILKRQRDMFIDGKEAFSFVNHREASEFGNLVMSWQYPESQYETSIYTVLLAVIQGRGQPFGV